MLLDAENVKKAKKLLSEHVDSVTCYQCCKYYVAPETASCCHTLCHLCWKSCQTCPLCGEKLDKKTLLLNMQMKIITEHVKEKVKSFKRLFGIKTEEFASECLEKDQNVKEWLSSSQNRFSAPPYSETPTSSQEILPAAGSTSAVQVASKIQVHSETHKNISPPKVVHIPPPQDDWDMIETVPDSEEVTVKTKEHVVGPMDLEPFFIDDDEYTAGNPRRSTRKREIKEAVTKIKSPRKPDVSVDKQSSNNSSLDATDKRLDRAKQNWTNVKKMRKEFSKLNKENKNKLNVSIEMCKKSKSVVSKQTSVIPPQHSPAKVYTIEENTPEVTFKENFDAKALKFNNETMGIEKGSKEKDVDLTKKEELPDIELHKMQTMSTKSVQLKKKLPQKQTSSVTASQNSKPNILVQDQTAKPALADEQANDSSNNKIPFLKKSTLQNVTNNESHTVTIDHSNLPETKSPNDDDIHISIKTGSVVTIITINKKNNDVQLKVNSDREVQASLGPYRICNTSVIGPEIQKAVSLKDTQTGTDDIKEQLIQPAKEKVTHLDNEKSCSTKKHTASAETASAQYEITESVEKELSNIMECDETERPAINEVNVQSKNLKQLGSTQRSEKAVPNKLKVPHEMDGNEASIDDLDIFNSGSVKEINVKSLMSVQKTPSEIFVSTHNTKGRTQKPTDKRNRYLDDDEISAKRQKLESQKGDTESQKVLEMDSINDDAIMSQVLANSNAEMNMNTTTKIVTKAPLESEISLIKHSQVIQSGKKHNEKRSNEIPKNDDQKYSENMFSTVGNIDPHVAGPETQKHIDNLLTPGMCRDLRAQNTADDAILCAGADKMADDGDKMADIMATPDMDDDDSDKSVVEDTPQKNGPKPPMRTISANRTVVSNKKLNLHPRTESDVINISDTDGNDVTMLENKRTVTPPSISRFVDQIKHNSTPFAKKSLNFTNEMENDDVTLCPSNNEVAKTTQEKELMMEAFNTTPVRKPLQSKIANRDFVIAGSCLSATESTNLKILCFKKKWLFVDKYSPNLTHLVVGVDENNRSQRSVKYMCALAAGKWIISYKWVEKCLETNNIVNEEAFEALDSLGASGPRRARLAKRKLFEGMTFYCMPPFTVLDVDTLKIILEAAGARVAANAEGVRVRGSVPTLLLAEPAHTQEDKYISFAHRNQRFCMETCTHSEAVESRMDAYTKSLLSMGKRSMELIKYLAMELNIVPVNYEWVLNCLGSYSLCSLMDLLLCPSALLPKDTKSWPAELLALEDSG